VAHADVDHAILFPVSLRCRDSGISREDATWRVLSLVIALESFSEGRNCKCSRVETAHLFGISLKLVSILDGQCARSTAAAAVRVRRESRSLLAR